MIDLLLKSIGYTPERFQNELADFKGMAQDVRGRAARIDSQLSVISERLSRIEAHLNITVETKDENNG